MARALQHPNAWEEREAVREAKPQSLVVTKREYDDPIRRDDNVGGFRETVAVMATPCGCGEIPEGQRWNAPPKRTPPPGTDGVERAMVLGIARVSGLGMNGSII